jgi:hypothetical protein
MSGDYPGNAPKRRVAMTVERSEPEIVASVIVEPDGDGAAADPAGIRPALARLAASNLDALQQALLDAALSATTTRWATVDCGECGARSRVELPVPDVKARLQAIQLLLSESLGRPATASDVSTPQLPRTAAQVKELSFEEMQYVFATTYVAEIEAVVRDGGERALQERVSRLGQPERTLLLKALTASS